VKNNFSFPFPGFHFACATSNSGFLSKTIFLLSNFPEIPTVADKPGCEIIAYPYIIWLSKKI